MKMTGIKNYDVIVAGGGIAGVSAAIAAAREKQKVLLIESGYMLGGLATAGLITIYLPLCDGKGNQVSFGLAEELLKLSVSHGAQFDYPKEWFDNAAVKSKRYETRFDANVFAILMEQLLLKEKVEILYGTTVVSADTNESKDKIRALKVYNREGLTDVFARTFVDATGDAAICRLAGEKTAAYGDKNLLAAWYYEVYDGEYKLRTFGSSDKESSPECYANGFDATNAKEVSVATAKSHASMLERFLHNGKVSEKHGMATIPTVPLIRMSERLDGVYSLKMSDERKAFADSVGCFASWKEIDKVFELPYSCLTGTKIKNVITAGRCISANDDVWELTRVIPVCAVSGEAAGIACSMGDDLGAIDVTELQNKIRQKNGKIHLSEIYK